MSQHDQLFLRSDSFPARTLLDSYYDRQVTQLSDRGLASNMIGDRWSDLSAQHLDQWPGTTVTLPDGSSIDVQHVYRLDATPQIASIASKRKLQNADFIVVGNRAGNLVQFAIDAKFSIETAKSAQVSAETLSALLEVGDLITAHLPGLPAEAEVLDGYFISPDMPLTHYVMGRPRGRMAARVDSDQVFLVPVQPVPFLKSEPGSRLLGPLAVLDGYRDDLKNNMLLAMYYFRLARACYGAYGEITRPIFGPADASAASDTELEQRTIEVARSARSSWDVVLHWDNQAEQVRAQRETAYGAMAFPIPNRELRDRIVAESERRGVEQPSINSVRKRIGGWYREQFDLRLGTVLPPVEDMTALLQQIHQAAVEVLPLIEPKMGEIIDEVLSAQPPVSGDETTTA